MKRNYRLGIIGFCYLFILSEAHAQADWPIFGHDPGAMRYSPLKQINTSNVDQLRPSWQFDTTEESAEPATVPITAHANLAPEASPEAKPSPKPSPGSERPAARRATLDGKFRAFDSRTGRELWVTNLGVDVNSIPVTWKSKNGKQYVAVFAAGGAHGDAQSGRLLVYSLP